MFSITSLALVFMSMPSGGAPLPPMVKISELGLYIEPISELEAWKRSKKRPVSRIITIGDVHGCYGALRKLLRKMNYSPKHDEVILLGDFLSKGPKSFEVLDYAIENQMSCVLGNHELLVLQKYSTYYNLERPKFCTTVNGSVTCESTNMITPSRVKYDQHLSIAKRLKQRHLDYLTNCSIILDMGLVGYAKKDAKKQKPKTSGFSQHVLSNKLNYSSPVKGLAVHAGLQWNLALEDQSVDVVTNIRGLYKPDFVKPSYESRSTVDEDLVTPWSTVWNEKQEKLQSTDRKIVFYGHESSRGLSLKDYAKGLDSGCVRGGELSALVIQKGSKKHRYIQELVQVKC